MFSFLFLSLQFIFLFYFLVVLEAESRALVHVKQALYFGATSLAPVFFFPCCCWWWCLRWYCSDIGPHFCSQADLKYSVMVLLSQLPSIGITGVSHYTHFLLFCLAKSCHVAQIGFELMTVLPQPFWCRVRPSWRFFPALEELTPPPAARSTLFVPDAQN